MFFDQAIIHFDRALRTLAARPVSSRPTPGANLPESDLSAEERKHAAALMRVNHVGEICAQALYQGQAIASRNPEIRVALERAGEEETEHLAWTLQRIEELGSRPSLLNPLWFGGALAIGTLAGVAGEKWNLGFLAETERQVEAHLDGHLEHLPASDLRSLAVVDQMRIDEIAHAETAVNLGGVELPSPVKLAMKVASKVMTKTAYYL